jgi:hypothetical protein
MHLALLAFLWLFAEIIARISLKRLLAGNVPASAGDAKHGHENTTRAQDLADGLGGESAGRMTELSRGGRRLIVNGAKPTIRERSSDGNNLETP